MTEFGERVTDAIALFSSLRNLYAVLQCASDRCIEALNSGHKLLICGNGGSASEAQHLAGELVGRYKHDRAALPAIALTADAAVMTCIGNDYRFDDVFSRQIRALGAPGDVLVAFTTSGNSPNVVEALAAAREKGLASVAFLGKDGGRAREMADCPLLVGHQDTARIQEAHQFLMHCLMDAIEAGLTPASSERT